MARTVVIADHPLDNPHRYDCEVHHRLYLAPDGTPTVIGVQDFDYRDYTDSRFLTVDSYLTEDAANIALGELLTARLLSPQFDDVAPHAVTLAWVEAPLTRQQAVDAFLSGAFRD